MKTESEIEHAAVPCSEVRKRSHGGSAASVQSLHGPAIVGKFYMVPCVRIVSKWPREQGHPAAGRDGWIPVMGPEHHDRDIIGFQAMHIHIDARFVAGPLIDRLYFGESSRLLAHPVSTFSDGISTSGNPKPWTGKIEHATRRLKCRREMPPFPVDGAFKYMPKMERAYSGCKLKPGNICPHRGIDLTPFVKPDGTVICPGHGLRWDTKSGALLPHHAAPAQQETTP